MDEIISINAIVTDFYKPLFDKFFLPSIQNSPVPINIYNSGIYGDGFGKEFKQNIQFKIGKIIDSLKNKKPNQIVVWSDVDIIFCKTMPIILNDLLAHTKNQDISASPEHANGNYFNSGFLCVRSVEKNVLFFERLLQLISEKNITEQPEMNRLVCEKFLDIKVQTLPIRYWNMTVGIYVSDPYLLHANYIPGFPGKDYVTRKINALNTLKTRFIKLL